MAETRDRLMLWGRGDAASENLAADILVVEGFQDVDPVHPQGGPDGGKDIRCRKGPDLFTAACYFPNNSGLTKFAAVKKKFKGDVKAAIKSGRPGFIFITNSSISDGDRQVLVSHANSQGFPLVLIYHLERLRVILDSPAGYAARLRYLEIEMSKEEQITALNLVPLLTELRVATVAEVKEQIRTAIEAALKTNQAPVPRP